MGVINVLDKHIAELIAAGEVVERPASVIKELVENAIDAKAKHITVEIKNGGTTFMRVSDDGCGIMKEDIKIAFLRHATSKVKIQDDLDKISTLGFRGEALASICAVSRLQLITHNINEENGSSYEIDGGEEQDFNEAGCPIGTTFIIRDLFYNVPARAKFLKKDVSEGNAVSNIIDKTALSHPEIAFTFIKDGKQTLKTSGDGKLLSAIYSVYGNDFAKGLTPVNYSLNGVDVYGYISKSENARPNRNMQNFFINGRYVKTRTAMVALEEGFKGSIMVGKFPSCVLMLKLPYEMIDVNVHPAKIEVRFINEKPVFEAVYHSVKSALLQNSSAKEVIFKKETAFNDIKKFNSFNNANVVLNKGSNNISNKEKIKKEEIKNQEQNKKVQDFNPFDNIKFNDEKELKSTLSDSKNKSIDELSVADSNNDLLFNITDNKKCNDSEKPFIKETKNIEPQLTKEVLKNDDKEILLLQNEEVSIKYIGELFKTYILAEKSNNQFLLIDKHAAHERLIYEKLKAEKAGTSQQMLLKPVAVSLSTEEYDSVINNISMFADCSFEVEDFGNFTVLVRAVPQYLDALDITDCIIEMAGYLAKGKSDIYAEKMDWFYHNVACRSAIKGGNNSSDIELIDLIKKLENNPQIKHCPHGRPISVVMKKYEIEKLFGRV